jgi:hypothetical protein
VTVYLNVNGATVEAEMPRAGPLPTGKVWARMDPARLLLLRE